MTGLVFLIAICQGAVIGSLLVSVFALYDIKDILQDILTELKWK